MMYASRLGVYLLMELPLIQPCYYDVRLCGKKKECVLYIFYYSHYTKKKNYEYILYNLVTVTSGYAERKRNVRCIYSITLIILKKIMNIVVAVLCFHGRSSSYIPTCTSFVIWTFQLWVHIIKIFQMKCKYI